MPREISSATKEEIQETLVDIKKREEFAKTCKHNNLDSETYEDLNICVDCRRLFRK